MSSESPTLGPGASPTVLNAFASRRSHYQIGPGCSLPHSSLNAIIATCVRHTPSMFNMQSTRVIILYGEDHRDFWDLRVASVPEKTLGMRPNVAHEFFGKVSNKLDVLRGAHGTVLFFEDQTVVDATRSKYPAYTAQFDTWSSQSSAIAQYAVWVALSDADPPIGMTLQHYYPSIDEVRRRWGAPERWKMTGQMPFGEVMGVPVGKVLKGDDELVRVFDR